MLTEADYGPMAARLGIETAALRAVAQVETNGSGFDPDGRPTILFEAHVFHRLTKGRFAGALDRAGVALSVPAWDRSLYGNGGAHQHDRLEDAAKLDRGAAHMACSWGAFQVLGANWSSLGYASLDAFLEDTRSSAGQLEMFAAFLEGNDLTHYLRDKDWAGFGRGYNGPAFIDNHYHGKVAQAYASFSASIVVASDYKPPR